MLVAGVALQVWTLRPSQLGAQYALQLPVVFLYAMASALILFVSFPDSVTEGRALGFSLGGATGFFAFFMMCSFAWLSRTRKRDALGKEFAELRRENRSLVKKLAAKETIQHADIPLRHEEESHPLRKARKFKIGIITGDLNNVTGVDVWVNSENTRMEMSRITEPTVSAAVRYLGAQRDVHGKVIKDVIADELRDLMSGEQQVHPGQVLTTTSGHIEKTHGAKRVLHVATVEGEPGQGYRPVRDIGSCVRNALAEIDRLNVGGEKLRSAILPLFGTGGGSSDLPRTAEILVSACADYLLSHRESELRVVYVLAHTGAHVAACELALHRDPRVAMQAD